MKVSRNHEKWITDDEFAADEEAMSNMILNLQLLGLLGSLPRGIGKMYRTS
ncbi:Transposase [Caenorhabditis elegans]|uniref:Transposase n=1 Tax=Caenorhabditis elegans TaxID=6239 RepID=H2L271_CAEEL|nr:Transposase [Caenorhabditis elegans]CCE71940.1 Transposase [Caenorhabditis elegans]|eukprot:NP_001254874.1 Uncharacterized protein CELE_C34C12.12 [Caenorhabditis elegans]